ncbi:hypothetical protein FHG87_023307, partial [Trinorchestia longiramus]
MDCQPHSSKSSKPHYKGGREATYHEVGAVRQDPQGEESHSSSLASSPSISSMSREQLSSSGLSVRSAAPYAARASQPSVNLPSTSVDHSNYVYCVSNMNDLLQNSAPAPTVTSGSSSTSGKRSSVHEDHLSSLLPKHFSQMSQNSQQAVLEQLLASTQSDVAGGSSKAREAPLSTTGIVVSLPSHSSSLNMPDSPGPPNKNDSSGSVGSSNNTMVIHGSSSPDSPWSQHWGSSLLHNSESFMNDVTANAAVGLPCSETHVSIVLFEHFDVLCGPPHPIVVTRPLCCAHPIVVTRPLCCCALTPVLLHSPCVAALSPPCCCALTPLLLHAPC